MANWRLILTPRIGLTGCAHSDGRLSCANRTTSFRNSSRGYGAVDEVIVVPRALIIARLIEGALDGRGAHITDLDASTMARAADYLSAAYPLPARLLLEPEDPPVDTVNLGQRSRREPPKSCRHGGFVPAI